MGLQSSIYHFFQSHIFRLLLLALAIFAGIMLLSLNIVYIIYLLLLPPTPTQLSFDGDTCAQRKILKQMMNQGGAKDKRKLLDFEHVQTIWAVFGTPDILLYFIYICVFIGPMFFLYFMGLNMRHNINKKDERDIVIAYMQHSTIQHRELVFKNGCPIEFFGLVLNALVFNTCALIYPSHIGNNVLRDAGIRCIRLVDVVQITSLLMISFNRGSGNTRRYAKLQMENISTDQTVNNNNNKTRNIEYYYGRKMTARKIRSRNNDICTCCRNCQLDKIRNNICTKNGAHSSNSNSSRHTPSCFDVCRQCRLLFIAVISDHQNAIGICIFLFCCILQIVESLLNEWSLVDQLLSNFPPFRALLAQNECICTVSAGCPLEHFVFAEFIFCMPITYIWRIFKHWRGLLNQRRYIYAIYPTISEEEKRAIRNRGKI